MSLINVTTDVQQICTWLGLPPNCWPPDHYTLLRLPPGEPNVELIEQEVHEGFTRVRPYQLSHAALATEAMMHLAKAFDCLTNPSRKKAYDAAHFPHLATAPPTTRAVTVLDNDTAKSIPAPAKPPAPVAGQPPKAGPPLGLLWQPAAAPPPVRMAHEIAALPMAEIIADAAAEPPPVRLAVTAEPIPEPTAPVNGTVQPAPAVAPPAPTPAVETPKPVSFSCFMLERLATRRDFHEHLWWTRRLMRAWNRAGKYLGKPKRPLAKPAEDAELTRILYAIDDLLQEVPGLLGQPGQTGYRILALCSQEPVAEYFKNLDQHRRAALAADWSAGSEVLAKHRHFLMEHLKGRRRLTRWQRLRRAVDAVLTAHHRFVMLVVFLVAVLVLMAIYFL